MSTRPPARSNRLPFIATSIFVLALILFSLSTANFSRQWPGFHEQRSLKLRPSVFEVIDEVGGWPSESSSEALDGDAHELTTPLQELEGGYAADNVGMQSPEASDQPDVATPMESISAEETEQEIHWDSSAYTIVSSQMAPDKKWFSLDFGDWDGGYIYNANLLAHPWRNDSWYMIAQGTYYPDPEELIGLSWHRELVCAATFEDGRMQCTHPPMSLPIASTSAEGCQENKAVIQLWIGPHDARAFYGPDRPFIIYGSGSHNGGCLGQWAHDLRRLVRWDSFEPWNSSNPFFEPTELQRPPPVGDFEKNWFLFWDDEDEMYAHYDIFPHRAFAKVLNYAGNISEDLAPVVAEKDNKCLEQYAPKLAPDGESIHQATNSLAIIMCRRDDITCDAHANTYIVTIFHHKSFHGGHNLYEPYVMLFEQSAPFGIHAISAKPIWFNGRGKGGESSEWPLDQSQMMYVTSISWKNIQGYRGFLDDELLIGFGVEDRAAGAIDVVAADLIRDLNLCE